MPEEKKKALQYFYNLRATIDESNMLFDEDINVKCGKETVKQITTILNLIQSQQKEIEKLKNKNKDLLRKLRNRVKEVKKLAKYSLYKQEFSRLNKQIEKKDKIIDLILEEIAFDYDINSIADIATIKKQLKEKFEKKVEGKNETHS